MSNDGYQVTMIYGLFETNLRMTIILFKITNIYKILEIT